jgi:hypothetical protein
LRLEDFRYADQLRIALPQLALCIEVDRRSLSEDGDARDYQFKPGRTWHKLAHQTAGHACHQHYAHCTLLTPKTPAIGQALLSLTKIYEDSQLGCFGVSLDSVVEYRGRLQSFVQADCNRVHQDLEEGWLPIDIEFLPQLAADKLPSDLDELIHWDSGFARFAGSLGRHRLVVIHENSE